MEPSLTHEAFSQQANTKFQVPIDENTGVELELAEVSELKLYPQQEEFVIEGQVPGPGSRCQGAVRYPA